MMISQNSKFKNINRAPYEIGTLLQELPSGFSGCKEQAEEVHQIADAIERHTYNAKGTLLHGLEAIGAVLFSAGTNENYGVDPQEIASLGCLVRHLSVELQYLIEIEEECLAVKEKRQQFMAKKGGK